MRLARRQLAMPAMPETPERAPFEDDLYARLLACAQSLRRDLVDRACEANLTLTDLLALRHMVREDCPFAPSDIARALSCSRANATKIAYRLEDAGYVSVMRDPFSPRLKSLTVTRAGRAACAHVLDGADAYPPFSRLSPKEARELYRLLGLLGTDSHSADE
jgi:DNA-binding MarR family transcriptional regulator